MAPPETRNRDPGSLRLRLQFGLIYNAASWRISRWFSERQHLHINEADFRGRVTFGALADPYMQHELGDQSESVSPKSHTTIGAYNRVLRNRLLPRWGDRVALGIEPLEIEN